MNAHSNWMCETRAKFTVLCSVYIVQQTHSHGSPSIRYYWQIVWCVSTLWSIIIFIRINCSASTKQSVRVWVRECYTKCCPFHVILTVVFTVAGFRLRICLFAVFISRCFSLSALIYHSISNPIVLFIVLHKIRNKWINNHSDNNNRIKHINIQRMYNAFESAFYSLRFNILFVMYTSDFLLIFECGATIYGERHEERKNWFVNVKLRAPFRPLL